MKTQVWSTLTANGDGGGARKLPHGRTLYSDDDKVDVLNEI